MFSNVLMTTLTPLRNLDENNSWQNRPFTTIWPEDQQLIYKTRTVDQPKSLELKKTIKKRKRYRTAFNTEQLQVLEKTYHGLKYINAQERRQLAQTLNIGERSIKIWFQNRRMKEKRESSESSDSSTEVVGIEEFLPHPVSNATSVQEVDIYRYTPDVAVNQPYNTFPDAEVNQVYNHQFDGYSCQDLSNYNSCSPLENQKLNASMLPSAETFTDDRGTYPTSYYPTLVDYFLGESYQYESGNVNSNEIQWSDNTLDLNYFQ